MLLDWGDRPGYKHHEWFLVLSAFLLMYTPFSIYRTGTPFFCVLVYIDDHHVEQCRIAAAKGYIAETCCMYRHDTFQTLLPGDTSTHTARISLILLLQTGEAFD